MTRQTKDAATRAQEALDVEKRRVMKLQAKLNKAQDDVDRLTEEVTQAETRRDYLAQNPDLPVTVENQSAIKHPEPEAAPRKSDDPVPEF